MTRNGTFRLTTSDAIISRLIPAGDQPRLVLLVGLPASGKSTFVEGLEAAGFVVLSLDRVRKEIYDDAAEQGDWRETRKRFDQLFDEAMARRASIVIDNTNFDFKHRKRLIEKGQKGGMVDVHLVLLDVPLEECLRRNKARDRVVPEKGIRDMYAVLYSSGYPRQEEGVLTILRPGPTRGQYLASGFAAPENPSRRRGRR